MAGSRNDEDGPLGGRRRLWFVGGAVLAVAVGITLAVRGGEDRTEARSVIATKTIMGTRGHDQLRGGPESDAIFAFGGKDHIAAGDSADLIDGGNGRDVILAGSGDDRIRALDGYSDTVRCGAGYDIAHLDSSDVASGCEEWLEYADGSAPATPGPPDGSTSHDPNDLGGPPAALVQGEIVLDDRAWVCRGPVDLDAVRVTMRTTVDDAVRLDQNCSGRIGRLEVDTWTADGIKVQNRGTVAHDLVIESGYVKCYDVFGRNHQDGIQVTGGHRLTFRNLAVDCLGNANLFLAQGGSEASIPTDAVCERCILGPNSAQTLFWATSLRSGARDTTICTGRSRAVRVESDVQDRVDVGNTILPRGHPSCADVTGRGRGS